MARLARPLDTRYGASDTGYPLLDRYFHHDYSSNRPVRPLFDQPYFHHEHDHLVRVIYG